MGSRMILGGGMYFRLLLTNATNFVLSGTKIVLVRFAYWSLREAKRLSERKSLEKRAVSSAWPIADMVIFGISSGEG